MSRKRKPAKDSSAAGAAPAPPPPQPISPPPVLPKLAPPKPLDPLSVAGISLVLVVAIWVVFAQTAWFDFVNLDDDQYVTESEETQLGFTLKGLAWAWNPWHSQVGNWHPLTTMSFMFDWSCFGANAGGYHIHNVILHCVGAVLLFLLLCRMTGAMWLSAMATALFALHPLRAESVAWVTERKDVLSNVFFMLTLLAYVHYAARPSIPRYGLVLVVFVLGLMTKAMLVTLPVLMLLLDYWPLARLTPPALPNGKPVADSLKAWLRRALWLGVEKAPLLLIALVFAGVTAGLSLAAERSVAVLPLYTRLKMAPISCVIYIGQMFWPVGLSAHYPYTEAGPPLWQALAACVVLLFLTAGALVTWKKYPYLIVGWCWYLVTLLPVIGLVPGGNQLRADRYTGITQIGLYVALLWLVAELSARWPQRRIVGTAVGVALVVAMMVATWKQTGYWRDSETLWRRALEVTTDNAIAHEHLAGAIAKRADEMTLAAAELAALRARAIYIEELLKPVDAAGDSRPLANVDEDVAKQAERLVKQTQSLAQRAKKVALPADEVSEIRELSERADDFQRQAEEATDSQTLTQPILVFAEHAERMIEQRREPLVKRGKELTEEARRHYLRAIEIEPKSLPSLCNLANIRSQELNFKAAEELYRQAIETNPRVPAVQYNLGVNQIRLGQTQKAEASFREAIRLEPRLVAAHSNLANLLREQGNFAGAIKHYEEAISVAERFTDAYNGLGFALLQSDQVNRAREMFAKIAEIDPENTSGFSNLAQLAARESRYEEATRYYRQTLAVHPHDIVTMNNLGDSWNRRGKFDQAIVVYELAAKLAPESALVRYNLAYCYEQKGRSIDAHKSYQQAWLLAIKARDRGVEQLLRERFGGLPFLAP